MTEKFIIGLVGAAHGLKGFVKVRSLSGDIDHLAALREVIVRKGGREQNLKIEECVAAPPLVLMKFTGVDNPETAKTLAGSELIADRGHASPLQSGEFYVEDLKGLAVKGEAGEILGHVAGIVEGGSGELAEIRLPDGELKLVPFRHEFFSDIDPLKGFVVLKNNWILE